jgi:hypothetical protein
MAEDKMLCACAGDAEGLNPDRLVTLAGADLLLGGRLAIVTAAAGVD